MNVMYDVKRSDFEAPAAQPFFLSGSQTGLLLLHGFTSTPQSMRYVGMQIHAQSGVTVLCPLLAGHGITPAALAETNQHDWLLSAEAALDVLAQNCTRIFVGGLSLGATLAMNLAARLPDRICGVVSINGSTGLYRPEVVMPLYDHSGPEYVTGIGSDIADPEGFETCYDAIPRVTLKERFLLTNATGALLPLLRQPIYILQSRIDHVVDPRNATRIASTVASDEVHLCWLNRSWHVATLDYDSDLIAARIAGFL